MKGFPAPWSATDLSTVPRYIVDEINALGGNIQNAYGISKEELKAAIPCGIGKINVDTDIRLAVTRNLRELFRDEPALRDDPKVGGIWKLLDEKRDAFDPARLPRANHGHGHVRHGRRRFRAQNHGRDAPRRTGSGWHADRRIRQRRTRTARRTGFRSRKWRHGTRRPASK